MKRAITALFTPILAVLACGTALAISRADGAKVTAANLSAHLATDSQTYARVAEADASTMHATYTISNPTSQPIVFMQRGLPVDWKIVDGRGQLVYDVNKGKMIPQFIARRILQPGAHQDFKASIKLQDQDGNPLPAGQYVLQACLTGEKNLQTNLSFAVK